MDDLLREFLTETSESLDTVDNQLVRFEQDPSDAKILDNIFRLVHTIKGTCGFLGLPRLEALAHAGETLMGKFRDGMPVKAEAVTLILSCIDRIKEILAGLEATETEPEGTDEDLIEKLHAMAEGGHHAEAEPAARARPRGRRTPGAARDHQSCQGHAGRPGAGTPACVPAKSRSTTSNAPSARPRPKQLPRRSPRPPPPSRAAPAPEAKEAAKETAKEAAKAKPAKRAALSPTPTFRKPTRSPTSRSASTSTRSNI